MDNYNTYDLAFSMGQACPCSVTLRTAKLQFASFPLDWIARGTLSDRVALIVGRFAHWLDAEDFIYEGKNPANGLGMFINKRTGLRHLHDFSDGPIKDSYAKVLAKYARREKRLFHLLETAGRVLLVYIDRVMAGVEPAATLEEVSKAKDDMTSAFPNASFDFIHFIFDKSIPFEKRIISRPAEGITEIRFNYHDEISDINVTDAAQALLSLGIKVRDYRTKAERNAHRLKKRMKKYGVNTRLELFLAKTKDRISRLLGRKAADTRKPS